MDTAENKRFGEALREATERSLADWGFVDIKMDQAAENSESAETVIIRMGVDRPLAGELFFCYSSATARRIAENLFKGEMLVSGSILKDIMSESSNIIVGLCFQLFAPKEKIAFGLPQVVAAVPSEIGESGRMSFRTFENEKVTIAYQLR